MDWLDVKPKTAVSEEELFSREEGFLEALTGIYMQMSNTRLYGRELSYGIVDILAQRYEPTVNFAGREPVYADPDWYRFPSDRTKPYIDDIWRASYATIANINNLLEWMERNAHVITTPGYREVLKGEALGLRAFIYTDLLRLYGPIFKNAGGPQSPTLPYRKEFSRADMPLSTAAQVVQFIVEDLRQAEELLADDPMWMQFVTGTESLVLGRDPFLIARYKRMNLMAVKALSARVHLWAGNTAEAARYAQEVVDARRSDGEPMFQLVTNNVRDRVFSTELIFSMSVHRFNEQADRDFVINMANTYLIYDRARLNQMFDVTVDGANDMRYRDGQGFNFGAVGAVVAKYDQSAMFSADIRNTIPLIRLSEMYYILAECAADFETTRKLLSAVREARGTDEIRSITTAEQKLHELMKEYRKEFYAEGQLWYFYKRHFYRTFLFCPFPTDMMDENYRFPLPENEVEFGNY